MAHRKIWLEDIDPIEEFIDRQLASLWINAITQMRRVSGWGNPRARQTMVIRNDHEDQLIKAIDRKNFMLKNRLNLVYNLFLQGYRRREIAEKLKVSIRTVAYDIRTIRRILNERQSSDTGETASIPEVNKDGSVS